jgi:signal transduction histidine kinase
MRDVADESYNIVREKLESIHLDTLPVLNNLLNEHGRKISQRANFNFDCSILGSPKVLSLEIQRTIFYVFQEILSNIERHAGAARVNVVLDWRSERFVLTISDDGMGFNPQSERSSTHLGLEIVRERLDGIKGFINIRSSPNSGTIVEITVPYSVKTPDMIYE